MNSLTHGPCGRLEKFKDISCSDSCQVRMLSDNSDGRALLDGRCKDPSNPYRFEKNYVNRELKARRDAADRWQTTLLSNTYRPGSAKSASSQASTRASSRPGSRPTSRQGAGALREVLENAAGARPPSRTAGRPVDRPGSRQSSRLKAQRSCSITIRPDSAASNRPGTGRSRTWGQASGDALHIGQPTAYQSGRPTMSRSQSAPAGPRRGEVPKQRSFADPASVSRATLRRGQIPGYNGHVPGHLSEQVGVGRTFATATAASSRLRSLPPGAG